LYDVVIPTVGRRSLTTLLDALQQETATEIGRIVVVDDRTDTARPVSTTEDPRVRVEPSGGRGPAAARNVGIRATNAQWVLFLDDDVRIPDGWGARAENDLRAAARDIGGVQGRIRVPLPAGRRPTDWERNVASLASARWITADMAYRRAALIATGGFDERFPRAYREDSDLALRVLDAGWQLAVGAREAEHPVGAGSWWISVTRQKGNADDELMARLHGANWRERAGAPRGRMHRHALATAVGAAAVLAWGLHRRKAAARLAALWIAATTEFAVGRISPGPATAGEIARMVTTSAVIPPVATAIRIRGRFAHRREQPRAPAAVPVEAVVVDRDGTIVVDVPYNGDPTLVRPADTAAEALERLRRRGLPVVVASNQSGVAHGLLTRDEVDRVNARVAELLGPFAAMLYCPHRDDDRCDCRKPAAGLVLQAAAIAGVDPARCVVIGDCAADVGAARAAGAGSILVPNPATSRSDIDDAPLVAHDLATAVDYVLAMGAA
jgi:histidinol-phosphate phosphatase family protein